MIGRFVKEHHIDASETNKLSSQGQLGLFATREFVDFHVHCVLVQAKSSERGFCNACNVAATACSKRLLEFTVALHDAFPIAIVECRVNHLCLNRGNFFLQFLELASLSAQFFLNGRIRIDVSDLREVRDANARSIVDITDVLRLFTDRVEECCFPCSIVTDNTDAVTVLDKEVNVDQYINWTKTSVDPFDVDELACHVLPVNAPLCTPHKLNGGSLVVVSLGVVYSPSPLCHAHEAETMDA